MPIRPGGIAASTFRGVRWNRVREYMAELLSVPFDVLRGFAPKSRVLLVLYLPFVVAAVCVGLIALAIVGVFVAAALHWIGINPTPQYDDDSAELGGWLWVGGHGAGGSRAAAGG